MDRCVGKSTRRTLIVGLLPVALIRGFEGSHRHIAPVDESSADTGFRAFRRSLLTVVRNRDADHLLTFVAPDILNSPGGEAGREEFQKIWQLGQPAASRVWDCLGETVQLGCVRSRKERYGFVAPYVYALFPDEMDPLSHFVVIRPRAKLYERPEMLSPVIEVLRWDIVESLEGDLRLIDWHHVRAASGQEGFVRETDVRSPADCHAIFQKRNGRWLIAAFGYPN